MSRGLPHPDPPPCPDVEAGLAMNPDRTLPWDWHPGTVPGNVHVEAGAYLETTYSFHLLRSRHPNAVRIGRGTSIYLGTMFDLGPNAQTHIGRFSLLNGSRIICDAQIRIGSYCLISWNVVLMDTRRVPLDPARRREALRQLSRRHPRRWPNDAPSPSPSPIHIQDNVWIGFDVCILPGVTVGEGSIVGARTVVTEDVPAYTVVAGNPARIVRSLDAEQRRTAAQSNPPTPT